MRILIGFSTPNTFKIGAWLIKKWLNSSYSHVFIRYVDNQNRDLVFQASHGMVHLITYENFLKENLVVKAYPLDLSNEEYQLFRNFYYSKLGEPYSFLDLVVIFLYDLFMRLGIPNPPSNNFKGYVCSSLCAEILSNLRNIEWNKPMNLVEPSDIENVFK